MVIDDAISGVRYVIKILKYKDFTKETDISNNGDNWTDFKVIQKISEQHTEKARISRNYTKQPYRGTAHVFRKVLVYKYNTFNTGNNITCGMYCKYRIAATLYNMGNKVSGI